MEIKKNEEYIVDIIDNGMEGEGIAKIDDLVIFIPGAIKKEKIKILIVKVLKTHAYGKIIEIIKKSPYRVEEDCTTYKRCGGCKLRHIDYEETLNIKQQNVQNLVNKAFKGNQIKVQKTIGMGNPYHYRNKAQYPVGVDKDGKAQIGVFAERSHKIIPMQKCFIQNEIAEKIAFAVYKFINQKGIEAYNEKEQKGILRHIIIKVGIRTHEVMCILVVNNKKIPYESQLVDMLAKEYNVKTIVKNINDKNTNVILGNQNIILHGDGYIYDILGDYTFKISPMSFYQVNPVQAEVLYNIAIEMAKLNKEDILFDLYCGIGTIGIFSAQYVKKVYGIEIVEDAIKDAKENAKINNIENIHFYAGDVERIFSNFIEKKQVYPDVIIVDPPRRGLDENTISNILAVQPKKVVYISCNPSTMVRDMKLLEESYSVKEIQPVDMFPFTSHVECCSVLYLKDSIQ
ncbi:MAG: 23S rRNA (uracil(1939)-C(5))-methyltransferase RlmD [Clostridia bacterium]|nr:23S rRNA (uracil(1939)-C(5))-methyltransferase RlmD [Clostridia bacterium]